MNKKGATPSRYTYIDMRLRISPLISLLLSPVESKPIALRPSDTDTLDWSTTTTHIRECGTADNSLISACICTVCNHLFTVSIATALAMWCNIIIPIYNLFTLIFHSLI